MSDKNKINNNEVDDDDFEIEFVDNDEELELVEDLDDDKFDDDFEEEEEDEEFDPDEVEYNPDEDYDAESEPKVKLTKNQIINRVLAGMGIAIAAFTIFYGVVAYAELHKDEVADEPETTTVVQEETTEQSADDGFFISSNSDAAISDAVKDMLKEIKLDELKTGHSGLDSKVSQILDITTKSEMSTYENIRNIYDYLMATYDVKSSSFVDDDSILDFCSSYEFISNFDMELMYRADKLFKDGSGDSRDYASAFTVLLRRLGVEAYYIEGEMKKDSDYDTEGYTVVKIDNKLYVFDAAEEDTLSANTAVEYKTFCKTFDELGDKYSESGVEESMNAFSSFKTLGEFSFSSKISTTGGDTTSGTVGYSNAYSEEGNSTDAGTVSIEKGENVYLKGNVSGSKKNTWKLIARVYDDDMNYITESTLYTESTSSDSNEVTYTPARGGNVKLIYMVTDSNGRTCTITVMVKVQGFEVVTTTERETESSTEEVITTVEKEPVTDEDITPEESNTSDKEPADEKPANTEDTKPSSTEETTAPQETTTIQKTE